MPIEYIHCAVTLGVYQKIPNEVGGMENCGAWHMTTLYNVLLLSFKIWFIDF